MKSPSLFNDESSQVFQTPRLTFGIVITAVLYATVQNIANSGLF